MDDFVPRGELLSSTFACHPTNENPTDLRE
jgi:hypothetical protein